MEHVQNVQNDIKKQMEAISQMVTVLTESSLIEHGIARELFGENR